MLGIQFLLAILVFGYFATSALMVFFLWPSWRAAKKRDREEKKRRRSIKVYKAIRNEREAHEGFENRPAEVGRFGRVRLRPLRERPLDRDDMEGGEPAPLEDDLSRLQENKRIVDALRRIVREGPPKPEEEA